MKNEKKKIMNKPSAEFPRNPVDGIFIAAEFHYNNTAIQLFFHPKISSFINNLFFPHSKRILSSSKNKAELKAS